jgi:hypothetical protein
MAFLLITFLMVGSLGLPRMLVRGRWLGMGGIKNLASCLIAESLRQPDGEREQ